VLAAAVVAVVAVSGCTGGPFGRSFEGSVLILVLGSDMEGASVPVSLFTLSSTDVLEADAIDSRTEVTVAGTSYDRLRDAYPFSGGSGVAAALGSSSESEPLPFVVLSAAATAALVGESGVTLALGEGVAAYRDGTLYRLPAGRHDYRGAELGALLASVDYLTDRDRTLVENAVAEAVARAVAGDPDALVALAEQDPSATDLSPAAMRAFAEAITDADGDVEFTAHR
jgi:hypothetical protein